MKRLFTAVFLAILAIAAFPVAFAENSTENSTSIDTQTQIEIRDMDSSLGAQMRLLQLERELQRKVIEANALIDALDARGANTTTLVDIAAELDVMVTQVQDAQATLKSTNNTQVAVEAFVTLKHDAKELINEFRDAAKALVSASDRETVKQAREDADRSDLKAISERIQKTRIEFRADRLELALRNAGIVDEELIAKVLNGTLSVEELRKELRDQIKDLPKEQRDEAIASIREDAARHRVQMLAHIDSIKERLDDRLNRTEIRIEKLDDSGKHGIADRMRTRVEERYDAQTGKLDERRERIEVRANGTRIKTEMRIRLNDDNSGSSSDDSPLCLGIVYSECNAARVGERCDPDNEATGYECDRVRDSCYGMCRADDSNDDSSACLGIVYSECNAARVGERCDPDNEATGYECDRVGDSCYGMCRADDSSSADDNADDDQGSNSGSDSESDLNDDDEDLI